MFEIVAVQSAKFNALSPAIRISKLQRCAAEHTFESITDYFSKRSTAQA
jgi:hypothetical protein